MTVTKVLRAPYPYFGGKSTVAGVVWRRFGDVANYVEPFFGSGAILLSRPSPGKTETINDLHAFIPNFWRAVQSAPDEVANYADWPVSEADLHARHLWLVTEGVRHVERCKTEPDYYDAKIAGWWVWGACQWIGSGWCDKPHSRIPHLGDAGMGVHKTTQQIPELKAERGRCRVQRKMPEMASERVPRSEATGDLHAYINALSGRLRRVRVCCGDWSRVMGDSVTWRHGTTGVFLDPPYAMDGRANVYAVESDVSVAVRLWCLQNGTNPLLRICLCGYSGEGHEPLEDAGWTAIRWKARGGYGSQGDGRGRDNAKRETMWFSPACLTEGLFE